MTIRVLQILKSISHDNLKSVGSLTRSKIFTKILMLVKRNFRIEHSFTILFLNKILATLTYKLPFSYEFNQDAEVHSNIT